MLTRNLMERPDNRTLEQAERAFHAVGMDVAAHPFFGAVIHALMLRIAVTAADIRRPVVGIEVFCIWGAGLADEAVKSLPVIAFRNLHPNRSTALERGQDHMFVATVAASNMLTLAADIGFKAPRQMGFQGSGLIPLSHSQAGRMGMMTMSNHPAGQLGSIFRLRRFSTVSACPARCFGKRATVCGTKGRDRLTGTAGRDVIVGLQGNDTIKGLSPASGSPAPTSATAASPGGGRQGPLPLRESRCTDR